MKELPIHIGIDIVFDITYDIRGDIKNVSTTTHQTLDEAYGNGAKRLSTLSGAKTPE